MYFNGLSHPQKSLKTVVCCRVPSDMALAAGAGYQKLLVLSGTTKREEIDNWKYPEEWKPEYYIENLNSLKSILESISKFRPS